MTNRTHRAAVPFLASLTATLLVVACTSEVISSSTPTNDREVAATTPPEVSAASCDERCAPKATSCGASAAQAAELCDGYCGRGLSEKEMACLEGESCQVLANKESTCIAKPTKNPSTPPAPTTTSTSDPRPPAPPLFGKECKCAQVPGGVTVSCAAAECGPLKCAMGAKCSIECTSSSDCPSGSSCLSFELASGTYRWCM